MRIGILGGTFNPIHLAHLRIAEEVREGCALDRILFMPAAVPPHKEVAEEVPFRHRLAMVETAVAGNPAFAASDIEGRRSGKSFSVHTLEILREEYPEAEFYFLMGMDSFRDLASWHQYQRLFELAHIVVTSRPDTSGGDPMSLVPVAMADQFCYDDAAKNLRHQGGKKVIFFTETLLDISSTEIRHKVRKGRSIRYLVLPQVENYIIENGLYRAVERST
ncbi:MAG: nicotinate (nicotinamide) nucleotide adenylyltransferase [Desulfuromonadales bacterium]|nr:nicotinate (nicotinamide) nucleotide adenylyltransferase [Desulfuromonadales bacterium]NIS43822.1 nicotinate (nicotinamide) nucleotide adenylyltransferase [Desulfuromonadales bacterium]